MTNTIQCRIHDRFMHIVKTRYMFKQIFRNDRERERKIQREGEGEWEGGRGVEEEGGRGEIRGEAGRKKQKGRLIDSFNDHFVFIKRYFKPAKQNVLMIWRIH